MRSNRLNPDDVDKMFDSWAGPWSVNWSKTRSAFFAQTKFAQTKIAQTKFAQTKFAQAKFAQTKFAQDGPAEVQKQEDQCPSSLDTAVSASSICNTEEILAWLGADHRTACDDASLINHVYRRRGIDGLHRLDGDFAAAIWDEQEGEMHCMRDHFGQQPLFYFLNEDFFLFASSFSILFGHPLVMRKPNLQAIAALSTDPNNKLSKERTLFEGIRSVLPASVLSVSSKGVTQKSYWSPNDIHINSGRSEEDQLSEIADRFTTAVSSRMPKTMPAIALLSGGLDSSGIVAVAAKQLELKDRKLITLSAIKEQPSASAMADEQSFMDCFSNNDQIDMRLLRSTGRGPFDNIESIMENTSVPMMSTRHYLYSAFAEEVSNAGGYSVLDGRFGELGLTGYGTGVMLEWFMRGRWKRLKQELVETAAVRNSTVWSIFRNQVLRRLISSNVRLNTSDTDNLFTKEFIQAHIDDSAGKLPSLKVSAFDHRALQLQYLRNAQKTSRIVGFDGFKQMKICLPYLDRRLLELCVSAPGSLKHKNGYSRYLIRGVLKNTLPEPIRLRTTKAPFSVDYQMRYERQQNVALEYVRSIGTKDPVRSVINVGMLEKLVGDNAVSGGAIAVTNPNTPHTVASTIYAIAFMRQFSEFC